MNGGRGPAAVVALLVLAAGAGCATGALEPVPLEAGRDACAQCRMAFAATSTAVEVLAAGEEPLLFDDLECFRQHAARHPLPPGARVVVTDHRTGAWVDGPSAVITRTRAATPMGSGLLAHATPASRDEDPAAAGGQPVSWRSLQP